MKNKSKRQATKDKILRKLKSLLLIVYIRAGVPPIGLGLRIDLDHIIPRAQFSKKLYFEAWFDPMNLQLIDRLTHEKKTSSTDGSKGRKDYRPLEVVVRLMAISQNMKNRQLEEHKGLTGLDIYDELIEHEIERLHQEVK